MIKAERSGSLAGAIAMGGARFGGCCGSVPIVVRLKSAGTKRRGKNIAVVALARKLLTTAYGVLKSGTRYDPRKLQPA